MRITMLTQYFPPEVGAAQTRLYSIALELKRRGEDVTVVTALPNYPTGRLLPGYRARWSMRERIGDIDVVRTWIHPATGRNPIGRLVSYLSFSFSALFGCFKAGRTGKADLVLVESPPLFLGLTGYIFARLSGTKVALNISDLWPASAQELGIITNPLLIWLAERLEHFLYRHVDFVTAVTPGIAESVHRTAPRTRLLLLPNGVDTQLFRRGDTAAVSQWMSPSEIAFIYGGTLGYVSGLDVIIDAASRLVTRRDIVFVFVGDGPEKARLQHRVEEAHLGNVRFVAPQPADAMPAFFSASRASIVPLRADDFFKRTLPAKIFPSLACSTPVIHCGDGDAAQLIAETKSGLVVPPERADLLAAAVVQLADDPELATVLGRHGRELVESRFAWSNFVGTWLAELRANGYANAGRPPVHMPTDRRG